MAYAQDQKKEEQAIPGQQPQLQPPTTSSAPGSGPTSATPKSAAPQATPTQPFQNLSAYLSANQPQITQQAQQIAGDLQNQYGQTKSAIDTGKNEFNKQIQSGYAQENQNLINEATANPAQFVSKPENVKAFQSLYNDIYQGPQNFETTNTYGNLSNQVNKARSDADLLSSIPGLQTYFQGKSPNATKGGIVLDAALLKGSPEAFKTISQAAKPLTNLQDYLTNQTTTANQDVQNAINQANAIRSNVQNQFVGEGGILPKFEQDISKRAQEAETGRTAYNTEIARQQALLNPILRAFNIYGEATNKPYQQSEFMKDILGRQLLDTLPTNENVANQSDFDMEAALEQLTGQPNSLLENNQRGQAGTFNLPEYLDQEKFADRFKGDVGKQMNQIIMSEAAKNPGLIAWGQKNGWSPGNYLQFMGGVTGGQGPANKGISPEFQALLENMESQGFVKKRLSNGKPYYADIY